MKTAAAVVLWFLATGPVYEVIAYVFGLPHEPALFLSIAVALIVFTVLRTSSSAEPTGRVALSVPTLRTTN
jgi:hypothetical protein